MVKRAKRCQAMVVTSSGPSHVSHFLNHYVTHLFRVATIFLCSENFAHVRMWSLLHSHTPQLEEMPRA